MSADLTIPSDENGVKLGANNFLNLTKDEIINKYFDEDKRKV